MSNLPDIFEMKSEQNFLALSPRAINSQLMEEEAFMPALAVFDPGKLWSHLQKLVELYMSLRRLTLKLPNMDNTVSIEEIMVNITVYRNRVNMEKAALRYDSPVDWFKAPFASIFMVTAESQDLYKSIVKPQLKLWVDAMQANPRARGTWLILYVGISPLNGSKSMEDMHGKVFGLISADFYSKVPGDRASFVALYLNSEEANRVIHTASALMGGGMIDINSPKSSAPRSPAKQKDGVPRARPASGPIDHRPKEWNDFAIQIGTAVAETFETRAKLYDAELRLLDGRRGTPLWDFGSFFIVKESLALMYRQFGLSGEALLKYQELVALLVTLAEVRTTTTYNNSMTDKKDGSSGGGGSSGGLRPSRPSVDKRPEGERLLFSLSKGGDDSLNACSILDYRKMKLREWVFPGSSFSYMLEIQLYIFARQCHLFLDMGRPDELAKRGVAFIKAFHQELLVKLHTDMPKVELWVLKASWDIVKACSRYYQEDPPPGVLQSDSPTNEASAAYQLAAAAHSQARDTSISLCALLRFGIERLFSYAQCLGSTQAPYLLESPIWQLYRKGEIDYVQGWVPNKIGVDNSLCRLFSKWAPPLDDTNEAISSKGLEWASAFWDSDEEGESTTPNAESPIGLLVYGVLGFRRLHQQYAPQTGAVKPYKNPMDLDVSLVIKGGKKGGVDTEVEALEEEGGGSPKVATTFKNSPTSSTTMGKGGPGTLSSCEDLERCYLQLSHSLASHYLKANRRRFQYLVNQRRAELYIARSQWASGIKLLTPIGKNYTKEGWFKSSFWIYHRLCICHRETIFSGEEKDSSSMLKYISVALSMGKAYSKMFTETHSQDDDTWRNDKEAQALGSIMMDIESFPSLSFSKLNVSEQSGDARRESEMDCICSISVDPPKEVKQGETFEIWVSMKSHINCSVTLKGLQLQLGDEPPKPVPPARLRRRSSKSMMPIAGLQTPQLQSRYSIPMSSDSVSRGTSSVERELQGRRSSDKDVPASLSPKLERAWDQPSPNTIHTLSRNSSRTESFMGESPFSIEHYDASKTGTVSSSRVGLQPSFHTSVLFHESTFILHPGDNKIRFLVGISDLPLGPIRVLSVGAHWAQQYLVHSFSADFYPIFRVNEFEPHSKVYIKPSAFVPPAHCTPLKITLKAEDEDLLDAILVLQSSTPGLAFMNESTASVPSYPGIYKDCSSEISLNFPEITAGNKSEIVVYMVANPAIEGADVDVHATLKASHVSTCSSAIDISSNRLPSVPVSCIATEIVKIEVCTPFTGVFKAVGYPPGCTIIQGIITSVSPVIVSAKVCEISVSGALTVVSSSLETVCRDEFKPNQTIYVLFTLAHDPLSSTKANEGTHAWPTFDIVYTISGGDGWSYRQSLPINVALRPGHGLPMPLFTVYCNSSISTKGTEIDDIYVGEPINFNFSVRFEGDSAHLKTEMIFEVKTGTEWMAIGTVAGLVNFDLLRTQDCISNPNNEFSLVECMMIPIQSGNLALPFLKVNVPKELASSIRVIQEPLGSTVQVLPQSQTIWNCRIRQ